MKELKPYIVEFNKSGTIKPKVYLVDYIERGNNRQSDIVITHDEYIFSANNKIRKTWA